MSFKKKLKIAGGLAAGAGVIVAGKKVIDHKSEIKKEKEKIKEKASEFGDEAKNYKEASQKAILEGKKVFKETLEDKQYDEDVYLEELEDSFSLDFVNHAPKSELIKIQGVGNALSKKIIENRPYFDLDEVKEKLERVPTGLLELEDLE